MTVEKQKCDNCEYLDSHCRRGVRSYSPLDWCSLWTTISKENPRYSEFALKEEAKP
jgi:hypothetical protein